MRWLFFALLGGLLWLLWRGYVRFKQQQQINPRQSPDARAKAADSEQAEASAKGRSDQEAAPQSMVRCAHCGAWSPQSLAFRQQDQWFCDENHARGKP